MNISPISFECKPQSEFDIADFLVYLFVAWYIIANCFVGPIIKSKIARPLWFAELGRQLFYYDKNQDNTIDAVRANPGAKVKINVDDKDFIKNDK